MKKKQFVTEGPSPYTAPSSTCSMEAACPVYWLMRPSSCSTSSDMLWMYLGMTIMMMTTLTRNRTECLRC